MRIFLLLIFLSLSHIIHAQKKPVKRIKKLKIEDVYIQYNPHQLRVPNSKFNIGIGVLTQKNVYYETKGYLKGSLKWSNFIIKVENGSYRNGTVNLKDKSGYLKDSSFTVKVYRRRGRKLLRSQKISYNYEIDLHLLMNKNFIRAPGSNIAVGIRTIYNNELSNDYWPRNAYKLEDMYIIQTNGAKINRSGLYINENPFSIQDHKVSAHTALKNNASISDQFSITLDYRKSYRFTDYGQSGWNGSNGRDGSDGNTGKNGGNGENGSPGSDGRNADDLEVYATVYFDTLINEELLYVSIKNLRHEKIKEYFINTNGGNIYITSIGGTGGFGGDGGDGEDGESYTENIQITDSTTIEIHHQMPGGNGGNGGYGGDGSYGGNGGNGGNITLLYTQYAEPFLHLIHLTSEGGWGGTAGLAGNAGKGGNAGSGSTAGSSGNNGSSGYPGEDGYNGYAGQIESFLIIQN